MKSNTDIYLLLLMLEGKAEKTWIFLAPASDKETICAFPLLPLRAEK